MQHPHGDSNFAINRRIVLLSNCIQNISLGIQTVKNATKKLHPGCEEIASDTNHIRNFATYLRFIVLRRVLRKKIAAILEIQPNNDGEQTTRTRPRVDIMFSIGDRRTLLDEEVGFR